MSFIGSLEKFDLSILLLRIEQYKKTGLLVVTQGERKVELSIRQGQLMCIGPVRPDSALAERLLQAGVISQGAYQEVIFTLGAEHYREVSAALALIDMGHVNQQSLSRWAFAESSQIIETLLSWSDGEIYFEENLQPPANRLLIALPISSLLPEQSAEAIVQPVNAGPTVVQVRPAASKTASAKMRKIADVPTMHGTFPDDMTTNVASSPSIISPVPPFKPVSMPSSKPTVPTRERNTDALARSMVSSLIPPQRVIVPATPALVNTAYMLPHMVLTPVDLSAYREQNPQVQLTPEQWRLFTRADGQTALRMAAQELSMSRDQVCQVAGELVALNLVALSVPAIRAVNEMSPVSREFIQGGLSNGMLAPGFAASPAQPWDAFMPVPNTTGQISAPYPVETHSQWGNGGNGATFILGNGWVVASSPVQPSQSQSRPASQYEANSRTFAKAG